MRTLQLLILICFSLSIYGQENKENSQYNKLKEIKGTEYVMTTMTDYGSLFKTGESLLIIDTRTGEQTPVRFPEKLKFFKIKQVKIDSLGINLLLIFARPLEESKSLFDMQTRLYVMSIDGSEVKLLTDKRYYISDWVVNKHTGTLVISGQRDMNLNNKIDSSDRNEILLIDLKTLEQKSSIK